MTDAKSPHAPETELSDDERALSNAIGLPRAPARSDAVFRAHVTSEVHARAQRRRFSFVIPALAGAGALTAVVLFSDGDGATAPDRLPRATTAFAADDDVRAVAVDGAAEDLAEEEALRLAAIDEIAIDDDTIIADDLDDDSLLALGAILDARLARVATR